MEQLQADGLVRSIGVSNYGTHHIDEILKEANVVPAVNQVLRKACCYPWMDLALTSDGTVRATPLSNAR